MTYGTKGDANVKTESTARNMTVTFSESDAVDIIGKIKVNIQSLFDASKERLQRKSKTCARESDILLTN